MREIKFRAYIKSLKWLVPVESIDFRYNEICVDISGGQGELVEYGLNWVELMQYTGLKDKNGVEIYEGDILDEYGYVVTFVDGADSASLGMPMGWYEQRDNFESYRQLEVGDVVEVIGNIYEHPHLLKGGS